VRAALLAAPYQIQVADIPIPVPAAGEVVVDIEYAGICGSDLALYKGNRRVSYPIVLGHEAIGRVVELGAGVPTDLMGQRVVVEPNMGCGGCVQCQTGRANLCLDRVIYGVTVPGCFAERVVIAASYVWPLPDEINWRNALLIEPLAVGLHALRLGNVLPGQTVAVVGCGNEGLLITHVASQLGANVIAVDKNPERLALAEKWGADVRLTSDEAAQRQRCADVVIEAAGVAEAVGLACQMVGQAGRVILIGLSTEPAQIIPEQVVRKGIHLMGSMIYDHLLDFPRAVSLVVSGKISLGSMVDGVWNLSEVEEAMQRGIAGNRGKIALHIKENSGDWEV